VCPTMMHDCRENVCWDGNSVGKGSISAYRGIKISLPSLGGRKEVIPSGGPAGIMRRSPPEGWPAAHKGKLRMCAG
jgi:hypothetical protein